MHILLTNDDGIHAEGLNTLKKVLSQLPDTKITVIAPLTQKSGCSHQITRFQALSIQELDPNTYALDGTPSDCVKIAMEGFIKEKIDFVISGINHGANMGSDVFYSGTIAGAREASMYGIPAIALSLMDYRKDASYMESSSEWLLEWMKKIPYSTWPRGTMLNINFPSVPREQLRGIRFTILGKRIYVDRALEIYSSPSKKWKYILIEGQPPRFEEKENSDFSSVKENFISITPLYNDITHLELLKLLKENPEWRIK